MFLIYIYEPLKALGMEQESTSLKHHCLIECKPMFGTLRFLELDRRANRLANLLSISKSFGKVYLPQKRMV